MSPVIGCLADGGLFFYLNMRLVYYVTPTVIDVHVWMKLIYWDYYVLQLFYDYLYVCTAMWASLAARADRV